MSEDTFDDSPALPKPMLSAFSKVSISESFRRDSATRSRYNPHLATLDVDYLYHLGLDTSMDIKKTFSDTKYVIMGGSQSRAEAIAELLLHELYPDTPDGFGVKPIGKTERYSHFKVGPVVSISHGMGAPSISILLNEIYKLLIYAGAKDFAFLRVGTCGGIGIAPGTVVVTTEAINGALKPQLDMYILGKLESRSTVIDKKLPLDIAEFAKSTGIPTVTGKTMSADDFYEGQGRLDGAVCYYGPEDRINYINTLKSIGVTNIEMEGVQFTAFCAHVGVPCAMLASTLVDRTKGDQVAATKEQLAEYSTNSQKLALLYIKEKVGKFISHKSIM